jgi:hypothetical protein
MDTLSVEKGETLEGASLYHVSVRNSYPQDNSTVSLKLAGRSFRLGCSCLDDISLWNRPSAPCKHIYAVLQTENKHFMMVCPAEKKD